MITIKRIHNAAVIKLCCATACVVCITFSLTYSMKPGEWLQSKENQIKAAILLNRNDQRISCVCVCIFYTLNSIAVDNYIGERCYTDYYRLVCITTKALIAPVIFNV